MNLQINQLVEPTVKNARADKYITGLLIDVSRTAIKNSILQGFIKVNGHAIKPSHPLKGGDAITGEVIDGGVASSLLPEDIPLEILYEDDNLIAINKPSGIVVHPGAGNRNGTLASALLFHFGQKGLSSIGDVKRPGIVHRLDKETSGVMIAAKKNSSHLLLSTMFKNREIKKEYRAIVWGVVNNEGMIDKSIGRSKKNRTKMVVDVEGRNAVTRFSVIRTNGWITELLVKPETGRTHQIRVHLSTMGHPIVGDDLYGGGQSIMKRIAPLYRGAAAEMISKTHRVMLHAERLTFKYPKKKKDITITAPLPDDFKSILSLIKS